MRGKKAKAIRKYIYKDLALKSDKVRAQGIGPNGEVVNIGSRRTYQKVKKHYKGIDRTARAKFMTG